MVLYVKSLPETCETLADHHTKESIQCELNITEPLRNYYQCWQLLQMLVNQLFTIQQHLHNTNEII